LAVSVPEDPIEFVTGLITDFSLQPRPRLQVLANWAEPEEERKEPFDVTKEGRWVDMDVLRVRHVVDPCFRIGEAVLVQLEEGDVLPEAIRIPAVLRAGKGNLLGVSIDSSDRLLWLPRDHVFSK
jgi:hypothetical protein